MLHKLMLCKVRRNNGESHVRSAGWHGCDMSVHAVAGYAAVHFGKAHVDRGLLIKVFASYTLLNALVNLITRRGFGEKVRQHRRRLA